ncbi:unnamed protein product [Peronospora belbahrii]|nr:unnamed protein product [Peronospora belbahrii]
MDCPCGVSDSDKDAALGLPYLQTIPLALNADVVDITTVFFILSNDLEAILNESDSDLENTSPSIGAELARDNEQKTNNDEST